MVFLCRKITVVLGIILLSALAPVGRVGAQSLETWWSIKPLERPVVPRIRGKTPIQNEIDCFIEFVRASKGLKPNELADRTTFIRRVTFDLHGLPPTPTEIDAFVKDPAPDAFEKLIDRLLASPRYGERWARFWLDLVHYADTHGYDKDKRRLWAWLFRDWVIRAFNSDLPYRRFVRYQLAGDVLFPDDPDGIIATGFVSAGPWDFVGQVELREGTIDKEKTRVLDRDDMVANTMSTFCSLTVHCARCHDHKFDPISVKEYYQLQAVFAGVERGDRVFSSKETLAQKNELEKKRSRTRERHASLLAQIAALTSPELKIVDDEMVSLQKRLAEIPTVAVEAASPTNGYHSGIATTADTIKWVQIDLGKRMPIDAVRLIPARPTDFRDSPGFGFPLRYVVTLGNDKDSPPANVLDDQTQTDVANPGDQAVTLPAGGASSRYVRVSAKKLWQRNNDFVFALGEVQVYSGGKNVALGAKVSALDSIEGGRWSRRNLVDGFTSRHRLLSSADPLMQTRLAFEIQRALLNQKRRQLSDRLLKNETRSELARLTDLLETLSAQMAALQNSGKVYAPIPIAPRPIFVLKRGDVERKGEQVQPAGLSLLPGLERHFANLSDGAKATKEDEGKRRAALAEWIVADQNVLTWRSIVNRVWQYHFGKGLVDTPSDFGKNGSQPTHSQLLDWLACELRDSDSFKRLHRKILLSATYRQTSAHDSSRAKIDADNRYFWRMNLQRLDAESVRDSVLAISGKMSDKMYGPGFDLFHFKDDHSPIYDHLDLNFADRPDSWRRTIYRFVVRSVPNPFLEALDCADPNINVPVRSSTMTALQALALLNNPFMVKQAEYFAEAVSRRESSVPKQVDMVYRQALGRLPKAEERAAMASYIARHGLPNACRLVFNTNEFLFVD